MLFERSECQDGRLSDHRLKSVDYDKGVQLVFGNVLRFGNI